MKRREFIKLIGGAAATWPLAASAQQAAMPVIGLLGASSADLWAGPLRAIRQGLDEKGYVEARNLAIEYRWAEGKNDRLPGLASDLVRRQVSVIVVPLSTPGALAAKSATTSIPVVFQVGSDPVAIGLVTSLNRPGGNLTGVAVLNAELGPKRLELLRELVPTATVIGCLLNPTSPALAEATSRELEVAARSFGLRLHVLHASSERDFDAVFATLVQLRAGGLVIGPDALFTSRSAQLAALALRHAVPTVYQFQDFAANGGLLSYGGSFINGARQLGVYCGRILKGERPSDLPVEQSTKVELIINLATAKALGLDVPPSLLARADEVIE